MTDTTEEAPPVGTDEKPVDTSNITLRNPVAANFASYIFGNATQCNEVPQENSHVGQTLVICGAGPTLADTAWLHS